jgi:hypothetical protein
MADWLQSLVRMRTILGMPARMYLRGRLEGELRAVLGGQSTISHHRANEKGKSERERTSAMRL